MFTLFKRGFPFAFAGMLTLTLWATVFAALSSLAAYGAACYFSPNRHNTLTSIVITGVTTIIPIALPLTFFLALGVSLSKPKSNKNLRQLLVLSALRSVTGAGLFGLIGATVVGAMDSGAPQPTDAGSPSFFIGLVAGWIFGFFAGLLWGAVECARKSKKAIAMPQKPPIVPPIAAP